jgi:hypothetical protein
VGPSIVTEPVMLVTPWNPGPTVETNCVGSIGLPPSPAASVTCDWLAGDPTVADPVTRPDGTAGTPATADSGPDEAEASRGALR